MSEQTTPLFKCEHQMHSCVFYFKNAQELLNHQLTSHKQDFRRVQMNDIAKNYFDLGEKRTKKFGGGSKILCNHM